VVRILNETYADLHLTYATVFWITRDLGGLKRDITRAKRFVNGRPRSEVIQEMFFDRQMKMRDIATEIGVDYQVVWNAVDRKRQQMREEEARPRRETFSPKMPDVERHQVY
jgi:hypothetical protein